MTSDNRIWSIDPSHTDVGFAVKHLMISTVKGRFTDFDGTVELDPDHPAQGRVKVIIRAASIDTRNADRDAHLRSADFFDADRFPTLTFVSRRVEPLDGGRLRIVGDLTIRGVTREVPLEVVPGGAVKDPWGNLRVGYAATAVVNRADFGLTWNTVLEAGGVVVGEDVRINIDAELVRQAEQAAA
jgi:polyisoprenoid-binding protein YceI